MIRARVSKRVWKQTVLFALVFAVIFSLVAFAQIVFVQFQANEEEVSVLKKTAEEVSNEIYPGKWDPTGYRQSTVQDTNYIILTSDGLLVDFPGFVRGLIVQARAIAEDIYEKPVLMKTEIGDAWLVAGRKLEGGSVVAGISDHGQLRDPQSILQTSLSRFGKTIDDAIKVKARSINLEVDYAILGEFGDVRDLQTGFPLRAKALLPVDSKKEAWYRKVLDGTDYIVYKKSILDVSGRIVGTVLAFDDISGQLRVLGQQKRFDYFVAFIVWLGTALGAAAYNVVGERKRRQQEVSLEEALQSGESQIVEFKEGIDSPDKVREVARAMAAFSNTNPGNIFIGIRDSPVEVVGIRAGTQKELDEFQKRIRDVAVQLVKPPVRIRVAQIDHQGKKVLRIFVPRGSAPVYFVDNVPYVRDVTSVSKAGPDELHLIFRSFARLSM